MPALGSYMPSTNIRLNAIGGEWPTGTTRLLAHRQYQMFDSSGNQYTTAGATGSVSMNAFANKAFIHYMTIIPCPQVTLTNTFQVFFPSQWGGNETTGYISTNISVRGVSNFGYDAQPGSLYNNGFNAGTLRGDSYTDGTGISMQSYNAGGTTFYIRQILFNVSQVFVRGGFSGAAPADYAGVRFWYNGTLYSKYATGTYSAPADLNRWWIFNCSTFPAAGTAGTIGFAI